MGEAKRRGTYEQRVAGGIIKKSIRDAEARRLEQIRADSYDKMVLETAADILIETEIMRVFAPNIFDAPIGKEDGIKLVKTPDNGECSDNPTSIAP